MAGIAPQACCAEHLFGTPVEKPKGQPFEEENRLFPRAGKLLWIRNAQAVPTLSSTTHECVSYAREKPNFRIMPRNDISEAGFLDQGGEVDTHSPRGNILKDIRLNTVHDPA